MKTIRISLFASGVALSAHTFAHSPLTTPDLEMWISGSPVNDKALEALFINLCDAGTLDIFKDNADPSKPGKAHSAFFCTFSGANVPGLNSPSSKVLLHKRSAGGSGQGVQPVADGIAIDAMVIDNGNCTETSAGSKDWRCTINNAGDLEQQVSDAGISRVEPKLFVGSNVKPGGVPATGAQLAKLDVTSMNAVIYGVPVTEKLRDALQEVQGLVVGDETEANMPSLSKSEVSSIISGKIRDWNQFKVKHGGSYVSLASYPFTAATAPVAQGPLARPFVTICRRVPGSGTQAQMNAKFNNSPCADGVNPTAFATAISAFLGPLIEENSGSGDVSACLNAANIANQWALGVQSLEEGANASGLTDDFRFVKIDGVAPTLENVAANKYFDWAEVTIQWRNASATVTAPTGDKLAILNKIAWEAASPQILSVLNQSFAHPFATNPGAYLAIPTNGYTGSSPFDPANPVVTATHQVGGKPNSCATPTVVSNSEL